MITEAMRAAFEVWAKKKYSTPQLKRRGNFDYIDHTTAVSFDAWQDATLAAREYCAQVCKRVADEHGGVAEGPFVTDFGKHTHQAMAAGAKNCEAAIRSGK